MFLTRLLSVIGSFASLFGLYFYITNAAKITLFIKILLLVIGIILFIISIIFLVKDYIKNSPKK